MNIFQWFTQKKESKSEATASVAPQAEQPFDAELEQLVGNLQEYNAVLQKLVQGLESHRERLIINAHLQTLADLDLGHMLIQADIFQVTNVHCLQRLQEVLNQIKAGADFIGKLTKSGARPPASLQEVLSGAMAAVSQGGELPPAIYMLAPNILMVVESTLSRIETRLKANAR